MFQNITDKIQEEENIKQNNKKIELKHLLNIIFIVVQEFVTRKNLQYFVFTNSYMTI